MPRQRKVPARFEEGSRSTYSYATSADELFKQFYFEVLDSTIRCIQERFDQDLGNYGLLADILVEAARGGDFDAALNDLQLSNAYKGDLNFVELRSQLSLLGVMCKDVEISSLKDFADWLRGSTKETRALLESVESVVKMALTLPATNAVSERSFSALRRVKSYLRSTMKQSRLNHALLLHVHKFRADSLIIKEILREYVFTKPNREALFAV